MLGTIRIELRKGVAGKNGMTPLSLIYSLNGTRKRYSINRVVFPEYWSAKDQRAIYLQQREAKRLYPNLPVNLLPTEIETSDINREIDKAISKIEAIEHNFKIQQITFSSQMVVDELKAIDAATPATKKDESTNLLFNFMDQYLADHQATRERGSLTVYKSVKNHLQAYQETTGHKVTFEKIDYAFFQKLQTFLINRTKTDASGKISPMLNNTTVAKALSTLKTFLSYAKKSGIKVNDTYRDFTIKREKLEVIALEQEEFDKLLELDLSTNKRLDKARDLFCFACATGLRYSDIAQLKSEHISKNTITLNVTKTKTELTIPLNTISASILEKYSGLARPLPIVSNQNLNYAVKDICELAGIDREIEIVRFHGVKRVIKTYPKFELVHFHTARKTFVTLSLEKGMSSEQVMAISGHTDYKSFKRYVNVNEKLKKTVMIAAWGEPETKLKVV